MSDEEEISLVEALMICADPRFVNWWIESQIMCPNGCGFTMQVSQDLGTAVVMRCAEGCGGTDLLKGEEEKFPRIYHAAVLKRFLRDGEACPTCWEVDTRAEDTSCEDEYHQTVSREEDEHAAEIAAEDAEHAAAAQGIFVYRYQCTKCKLHWEEFHHSSGDLTSACHRCQRLAMPRNSSLVRARTSPRREVDHEVLDDNEIEPPAPAEEEGMSDAQTELLRLSTSSRP